MKEKIGKVEGEGIGKKGEQKVGKSGKGKWKSYLQRGGGVD